MSFSFSNADSVRPAAAGAPARSEARTDAPPARAGLGLVYSQTSRTPIRLDPHEMRLRRMQHGVLTAARLIAETITQSKHRGRWAFVTLTYADIEGWKPGHISAFLDCLKQWLKRRGCMPIYVWVAELQKRGAMHYHVLIWLPKGLTLPKPDKQGWWPHGWTKIEWARNPVGYMAKYVSKADGSTKFPKGARLHGSAGLRGRQQQEARYWRRPGWLREQTNIDQTIRRRPGGGWFDLETDEIYRSPWVVVFHGGCVWLHSRLEEDQPSDDLPEWFKAALEMDMPPERILEMAEHYGFSIESLLEKLDKEPRDDS